MLCALVCGAAPAAETVAFCAPPTLREPLRAAIAAEGRIPLDESEIDDALSGSGTKERVAKGELVRLPEGLPAALRADFDKGQSGCRSRREQTEESRLTCAEHLVEAVWQRQLLREHVDRVIEIRPPDSAGVLEAATYAPADGTIQGTALRGNGEPALLKKLVTLALSGRLRGLGTRPAVDVLPEATPLPPVSLSQGTPQKLAALPLSAGCRLPATVVVKPPGAPLAATVRALWAATAVGHVDAAAQPLVCDLELTGPARRPTGFAAMCGGSLGEFELFAGTNFAEAGFQANLARTVVTMALPEGCAP